MDLISIIIPVYKTEKYLSECLDSILASTYGNLEIIVVDDGSPDECPRICDAYAQMDPRVKVIHQQNQGLVGARNTGLSHATGQYVGFVDSDDTISPKMYEVLLRIMLTYGCDVVACEYTHSRENLDASSVVDIPPCTTFAGIDAQLAVLTCAPSIRRNTWAGPYVWNRLYKRKCIDYLFRKQFQIGEDLYFNWEYIQKSGTMVIVPDVMYFYRRNEESISGQYRKYKGRVEKGISNVQVWETIAQSPVYTDSQLRNYIEARTSYMTHGTLWRIYAAGEELIYKEFVTNTRQLLSEHFEKIWMDKETYSLRIRVLIGIERFFFPVWIATSKLHGFFQKHRSV